MYRSPQACRALLDLQARKCLPAVEIVDYTAIDVRILRGEAVYTVSVLPEGNPAQRTATLITTSRERADYEADRHLGDYAPEIHTAKM